MKVITNIIKQPYQSQDIDYRLLERFANTLRKEDKGELAVFNIVEPHVIISCLTEHIKLSERAVAVQFDGVPAIIAGVVCQGEGLPSLWLGTTDAVDRYKKTYVRWIKEWDVKMREMYPRLKCNADINYRGACRLLQSIGFKPQGDDQFRQFIRDVQHGF